MIPWPVLVVLCGIGTATLLLTLGWWMKRRARGRTFLRAEDVSPAPVALVLGAGLRPDGSLTPLLADRVITGVTLYRAGRVRKLLMSGATHPPAHDEPGAMRQEAVRLGVPAGDILVDPHGFRTYDSCTRARSVFGIQRLVVVTQRFHAPRALYLCDALGIEGSALLADRQPYSPRRVIWETREVLARARAWWDVNTKTRKETV